MKTTAFVFAIALGAAGAAAPVLAQEAAARGAAPAKAGAYKVLRWPDLSPPGWDPIKELQKGNPMGLDDSPQGMQAMRDIWDRAPVVPALDKAAVKLPGYVVPLEEAQGGLKEFLLVPYFGACIHSPPPPANQIVHVVADPPMKGVKTMDVIWVSGTLRTEKHDSGMGVTAYRMDAAAVEPYVRQDNARPKAGGN